MAQEFNCQNEFGKLSFHRQSLKGKVQDFVISFNEQVTSVEDIINKTFDLFQQLMEYFKDGKVKSRLIAKVNYARLNDEHEEIDTQDFHFASYQLQQVDDVKTFYETHMLKILSRMDSFHQNGSRLVINAIEHIHIQMVICPSARSTKV